MRESLPPRRSLARSLALLTLTTCLLGLGPLATALRCRAEEDAPAAPADAQKPEDGADQDGPQQPSEDAAEKKNPVPLLTERVEVKQRGDDLTGIASSATEGITGRADLARRPLLRAAEILETVPGLIVTQHSGGGKANQYFLRGFNLDHGTDFRVTVADIPVNMPSHGHGQGYSDLNFIIPELVDTVSFRKGPYYAEDGDFSAAGSARIDYVRSLDRPFVDVTGGSSGYGRVLAAGSLAKGGGDLLGGVEVMENDGPWETPEALRRLNTVARYSRGDGLQGYSLTLQGSEASWLATDQIPERAQEQAGLDRFGTLDPSDGGESSRYSISTEAHRTGSASLLRASGYLMDSRLDLFSNFTYFLADPVNGDQFEQEDRRQAAGIGLSYLKETRWAGRRVENLFGFDSRFDSIRNGLFSTVERRRIATTRTDRIGQLSAGVYAQSRVQWSDKVRTQMGLRADGYFAGVSSNRDANSGEASDHILSPKFSLALGPYRGTEVFFNFGTGFHSNDARGATIRIDPVTETPVAPSTPLVRARGADVGFRVALAPTLQTSVSVFALDLDSELLFVGDGGTTEASRPGRRAGVEWACIYQPLRWLALDLDLAMTRARFTDDDPAGDLIPGAVEQVVSAGISAENRRGLLGSLRWRYFGPRPLAEDGSVSSATTSLVNARIGYRLAAGLQLSLDVFNLLDRDASDIDYFYESRLAGEAAGVEDIHFHPVEGRSARFTAQWQF